MHTTPSLEPGLGVVAQQPRLADHSADRRIVLLAAMAAVVGSAGAFAGWLLMRLVALVTNVAWFGTWSTAPMPLASATPGVGMVAIPVAGGLIIGLMGRYGSEKIRGHGIPEAIEAILFGDSRLSPKVAILKPISAAISIGTGGPFGAEGPIIMTGGALGSLFAQCFHLSGAERRTLLVAGAAAGMTAIFGTPLAAVLLALEVLLFEWKPRSFVPVVVAVLTSLLWRPALFGDGPLFALPGAIPALSAAIPLAVVAGLIIGLVAASLSTILYWIEDGFHRLPLHWMWWPAIGGAVIGIGGLADPRALGAGYANLQDLLSGSLLIDAVVLLLLVKMTIWLVALGSGTSGGVLAPLLTFGGALGAIAGHWLGDSGFWALAGMAGMMSAAMRAPLTGAIFAAELVGRIDVLPGTTAAAVAGYGVAVILLRRSILTEKIARRGRHLSQEYGLDPLTVATIGDIMNATPASLTAAMPVRAAIAFFERDAVHHLYPVIDTASRPIGLASRADALRWRSDPRLFEMTIGAQVSDSSLTLLVPTMHGQLAADLMIAEDLPLLPVIDPATGALIGIVTHRDLLHARGRDHRADEERGRFLPRRSTR